MNQEDLTSVERATLELLRKNATDAPEALASLSHASRGRVLGALSNPDGSTRPPTFVDRVWEPTVTIGSKKVPLVLSAAGVVLLIVCLVLLVRACGGESDSSAPGDSDPDEFEPAAGSPGWCSGLEDVIETGWDTYNVYGFIVDADSEILTVGRGGGHIRDGGKYTSDELAEFREAYDVAVNAGNRYDGRQGVRVWEESLRDAC